MANNRRALPAVNRPPKPAGHGRCLICKRPDRLIIDRELLSPTRLSIREYARVLGCSAGILQYHLANHVSALLANSLQSKELARESLLTARVEQSLSGNDEILSKLKRLLAVAEQGGNIDLQLEVFKLLPRQSSEVRAYQEFIGRLTGELNSPESGSRRTLVILPLRAAAGSDCSLSAQVELPPDIAADYSVINDSCPTVTDAAADAAAVISSSSPRASASELHDSRTPDLGVGPYSKAIRKVPLAR